MKWRKIPKYSKWCGWENGKHVASIAQDESGEFTVWVDGGNGFQKINWLNADISNDLWTMKQLATQALSELRAKIKAANP